jgi:MFS family permease
MKKHSSRAQKPWISEKNPGPAIPTTGVRSSQEKGLLRTFSSLRHRNYRLYWFGQMISLTGSYMQGIGQAWLVLELTHSAWQLGLVGALQALPILLFALFGGLLVDRWSRRHVLLATQVAAMLQAFFLWLLIASRTIQLWHVYVLALLLGFTNCLYRPAGQAFVAELVGREDLPNAVALRASLGRLTGIVGPGLGGTIIALSSVSLLFLLNALSFLAVIASLLLIKGHELHFQARQDVLVRRRTWQSLREGIYYIWHTPEVLFVTVVVGLVLLFGSNFGVLLPVLATDVLHVGATGFGFLSAATDVGALLAALWLAWSNRRPTIRSVLSGALLFGILEALFAFSRFYPLSVVLLASVCFAEEAFATQALTALQTIVPDRLRGRASSVQVLCFDGSLPLGYLLVGWLASLSGAPPTLLICALLCLVVVGAGWLWLKATLASGRGASPTSPTSL